jgi:hypothetical protein
MTRLMDHLAGLGDRAVWLHALLSGLAMEAVTLLFRFGLSLESSEETALIGQLTGGVRIHHGYVGLVMLLVGLPRKSRAWRAALIIVGGGLLFSDLVHHFGVLWPITGSPEFDLVYPDR